MPNNKIDRLDVNGRIPGRPEITIKHDPNDLGVEASGRSWPMQTHRICISDSSPPLIFCICSLHSVGIAQGITFMVRQVQAWMA